MKYLSLFSGIGGFEKGIEEATNAKCVGFSEIDRYAIQIYKKHFNHHNYGNITTISTSELPDFDLLVAGFPCQSFSIAGKRGGFDDTRGTLFFEIARILRDKRPKYFLLENVKGLLSHDSGKTFQTILKVLTDLGYDVEWQVLNSKNHGVPQNRERIFFVGYLGGGGRPKVFPIGENCGEIASIQPQEQGDGQRIQSKNAEEERDWSSIESGRARVRRLTPTECEKLQGFPRDWTKYGINEKGEEVEISDTQRYKTLGNAVTVNVIKEIMTRIDKERIVKQDKKQQEDLTKNDRQV